MSASDAGRIVVKIGSSLLIGKDGAVRRDWLKTLVADIAELRQAGSKVIIVSSGSIALGARRLRFDNGGRASLADAQAAASVGQIALAGLWSDFLESHDIVAAQMLLTLDDMEDRRRYLNATATLERLIEKDVVPVINENDSVATDEIRFGDNDRLAARVGQACGATQIILLSDVAGLFDRNPARHADAALIAEVTTITSEILAMADGGSASGLGSGGMASKLAAAQIANLAGIDLVVASGVDDHPLRAYLTSQTGTIFRASRTENARKSWLGGRLTVAGSVTIDDGAAAALRSGKSLLAAGVAQVSGKFGRGDVVDICDAAGTAIARGLSEYDAAECAALAGKRNAEHEAVLGYAPRGCVVHRNQMVML